tara:strand:+ start:171 stop:392 length:222 start_codon:yes stop_codon:yes gene_type:complete
MDIIKIVDYLKKTINTRQDQLLQVITGDVKSLEEYKFLLGKIHANRETIQELTDLLKKQEQYEDEIEDYNQRK